MVVVEPERNGTVILSMSTSEGAGIIIDGSSSMGVVLTGRVARTSCVSDARLVLP